MDQGNKVIMQIHASTMENQRTKIMNLQGGCFTSLLPREKSTYPNVISPIIQGRMKKDEYSRLSRRGSSGAPRSFAVLIGRGTALTRSGGSHPSHGSGYGMAMSIKYCGTREGPMGPH